MKELLILALLFGTFALGFWAGHSNALHTVKPIEVVDEWTRLPTTEELAAAMPNAYIEMNPDYHPIKNEKGETATRSHLQCPEGYELRFPDGKWESAICVLKR